METELVRMIADALSDADFGVAAALPHVPRVSGDAEPTAPVIYDESRHDFAALEEMPEHETDETGLTFPCLIVTMGQGTVQLGPGSPEPSSTAERQGEFEGSVSIHYFTKDPSPASARRAARYTLRAARGAVAVLFTAPRAAARKLNAVQLDTLVSCRLLSMYAPLEWVTIAGACAIEIRGREGFPTTT